MTKWNGGEKSEKQLLSSWVPIPAPAVSEITICLILSFLLLQTPVWSQYLVTNENCRPLIKD